MMHYANLEQRVAHTYIDLFPPFVPLVDGEVSVPAQERFYCFMKNVVQTIFDTPGLIFNTLREDDAYPNRFNRASYGKPKLYNQMKKDLEEIDGLMAQLFALGQDGTLEQGQLVISDGVVIKKKYRNLLPSLGLKLEGPVLSCEAYAGLFPAWKWMAVREQTSITQFARCMFDPQYPYLQAVYARLFGNETAFQKLVQYLEKNGYARLALQRGPYTLDYVRSIGPQEAAPGSPLHGDPYHYGISADYKPDAAVPQFLVLRIIEMRNLLLKFGEMPDELKEFTLKYVKQCDACGYCTQTDKTGKRKPLAMQLSYKGEHCVCPLYPGFNFCFSELNEELAEGLMGFLACMENHFARTVGRK